MYKRVVVVRRLPPSMTEEQFKLQVSPLPDIDYFYFVPADMSLMPNAFSRAYINFVNQPDLFIFTQKFDGYVFVDNKGGEFPAVVEFAPFQRIPKNRPNRKKDPKVGTIELDPVYIAFKEQLEAAALENKTSVNASKQHFFETSLVPEKKEVNNTPLLDFIKTRRAEKQRIRDEKREEKRKKDLERRRAKEEQRRTKKDDDTSVLKVLNSQNLTKERTKEKETKQGIIKKKPDEVKPALKEKYTAESRPKENKTRTGKSYLEERQRHAERREEQRKKLSQSQSSSSIADTKSPTTPDDKSSANGDTLSEEKPSNIDSKTKDTEYKKPERIFKREEIRRNSYKYENKRDRESDETRRTRRSNNERSYQISRRDDERSEDGGRKRYSESRKNYDSTRDRYKDKYKDKDKTYGQKKSSGSITELEKAKNIADSSSKPTDSNDFIDENPENVESDVKKENSGLPEDHKEISDIITSTGNKETIEEGEIKSDQIIKPKIFESKNKTKPTRRKSLDYDKSKTSTYSSTKSYSKERYSERKRRNSVGSNKQNLDNIDINSHEDDTEITINKTNDFFVKRSTSEGKITKEENYLPERKSKDSEDKEHSTKEDEINNEFEEQDRGIPKRRNSTGERQGTGKMSPRRNSLGSEDKNQVCTFNEHKFDSGVNFEEKKPKEEKKSQRSSRDPRTERRIRNKDRPSMALYRPGMGRLNKQRMEREKGLGSSTEVDSPSSSPSPTPILKHKTVALH